jgi:hypothetical protein
MGFFPMVLDIFWGGTTQAFLLPALLTSAAIERDLFGERGT